MKISALSVRRPEPPAELAPEEKETWKAVTATKPPDWWRPDTYPLLISYCKHVANAKRIDWLLEGYSNDQIKKKEFKWDNWIAWLACLDKMLKARDRESRALVNLARAMRLSQQAMILPRGAGRQTVNNPPPHEFGKPWE